MDSNRRLLGLAVAAAAATLFVAGAPAIAADSDGTVKVKCYGANSCKGQAECKTGSNSCKGQNSCKAKGFVNLDEKACLERLGRT